MGKEIATQVQEAQRVPYRINPRRNTPRHIVIKLTKIKDTEKLLKAAREKQQITYKGTPIRLKADLSTEILQVRREWQDIFKVMKGKNLQQRYSTQRGSHSDLEEKLKLLKTSKTKRIHRHQTSFTTMLKTSLSRKHKRRKRLIKTNPKQLRKW